MKTNVILKISAVALMAAATVLSCQKTGDAIPDASSLRTFTCTIGDPDTKLGIAEDGKTTWEVGDQILIHGEYTNAPYCETVTLAAGNISADKKTATFTLGDLTKYNRSGYSSNLYVAYPASAVVMNDHCYWNSRFSDTNQPLMVGYNKGNSFVLHNICGIITFKVSGSFDQYTLVGNNNEDVGYSALQSRIRYTTSDTENLDGFPMRTGTNDSYTTVAVKSVTASVVADGTMVNRICIPGGANFTKGFTIRFLNAGSIVKTVSVKPINVAYGKLLPLGDVTAYLKDYVAPTTHNNTIGVTVASATDLGSTATANCYIVSSAGDYKFKAVKGNSSTVVGTVASVDILWETWNNDETVTKNSVIAAADYDLQSGGAPYVVFKTPAPLHAGNALIAAKDAGDNILWSWHIWVPATAITQSTYGGIYGTKEIMDRNLGALVATVAEESAVDVRSYGMYYQWGRKDPFLAPATTKNGSMTYTAAQMSVEESIQNPTAYIKTGSDDVKDWNTASSTTLWGTSKTEYDPCPPGYVVPTRDKSTVWWADTPLNLNFEYNTTYKWCRAGVAYDSENSTTTGYLVFPICGYIDQGDLSNLGTRAYIWSSYSSSSTLAYQICFDGGSKTRPEQRKSRAGSVRCVAE